MYSAKKVCKWKFFKAVKVLNRETINCIPRLCWTNSHLSYSQKIFNFIIFIDFWRNKKSLKRLFSALTGFRFFHILSCLTNFPLQNWPLSSLIFSNPRFHSIISCYLSSLDQIHSRIVYRRSKTTKHFVLHSCTFCTTPLLFVTTGVNLWWLQNLQL